MPGFSIEIITKGEKNLKYSLDSMRRHTYNSFEIVNSNSSLDPYMIKILDDHSVKHLDVGLVRHLRGREISHYISASTYSFIMDSTRKLERNALDVLKGHIQRYEIVAIKEGSIVAGFWVNQAKIYKDISEKIAQTKKLMEKIPLYVLPRLYTSNILSEVFNSLRQKIPDKLFDSIGYGEHRIIFQEAISIADSFYYYKDNSIASIYRKYKSYGKDQTILSAVPEYNASTLVSHMRGLRMHQLVSNQLCSSLISLISISFLIGMISGKL